jgi:pyruvate-formate lyase-activating enzyme
LSVVDHDRGNTGMRYVYAVVSRRAAGVSIGVNLNPNNACNWRCIYCQVEGLQRGKGPAIDRTLLADELGGLLDDIVDGDFLERRAPAGARVLKDVAFSGNGEPTTSPSFPEAVDVVTAALERHDLMGTVPITLITNGTMLGKERVATAVQRLGAVGGRVWFKLDRATDAGAGAVNGQPVDIGSHLARLRSSARICPTWVQTCMFARDGQPPSDDELDSYVACMRQLAQDDSGVRGVLLYSLARPSYQPEAASLSALPHPWLLELAGRIEAVGMAVEVA